MPENCAKALGVMKADLAVVRWQVRIADPSQDPWAVLSEAQTFWDAPAQRPMVCALVMRHGSLVYHDYPVGNQFTFSLSLEEASAVCAKQGSNPCATVD